MLGTAWRVYQRGLGIVGGGLAPSLREARRAAREFCRSVVLDSTEPLRTRFSGRGVR